MELKINKVERLNPDGTKTDITDKPDEWFPPIPDKLSQGEIEDIIVAKYEPIKDDFKLMWEEIREQGMYRNFENWWSDFIRFKIDTYPQ